MDYYDEKPPRRLALKGAIAESGLTQRELAALIDRHEMWVSNVVTGKINPSKFEVYRIAACLRVHPRALFSSLYDWEDWRSYAAQVHIDYEEPPMRRIEPWER